MLENKYKNVAEYNSLFSSLGKGSDKTHMLILFVVCFI